jgi:hypothetical protein
VRSVLTHEMALGQLAAPVPQVGTNSWEVHNFLPSPGCGEPALTTPSTYCLMEFTTVSNVDALRVNINRVDKEFARFPTRKLLLTIDSGHAYFDPRPSLPEIASCARGVSSNIIRALSVRPGRCVTAVDD